MDADRSAQLREFVEYARTLKGDEKGEAQVFLDRLFRAFSRRGYKEAGATLEERVSNRRGGTSFADLVWKPIVLIEMKKRGEDLSRHLAQAFQYWEELVPGRPRYVVLCNFDEFRVYDFDLDIHNPQDTVALDELPERYGPLNFLWPTGDRVHFRIDREDVTRKAAAKLAAVYKHLASRVDRALAQRFVLQSLVCLFSEDIGLLPPKFFLELLDDCVDPPKSFDLLDALFRAMNTRGGTRGGRFASVAYFNGGLFAESAAVELDPHAEVAMLKEAASYRWNHVSPDIFGTIFQSSMDKDDRHAFGAHYTSQPDIMRIVRPTIIQPWEAALDAASDAPDPAAALLALRQRLSAYRVLDPACGSGNFLYVAYRELKRIEASLAGKLAQVDTRRKGQREFGVLTSRQFFGLDILPFAVELAKVTMTLAHKLSIDELHIDEKALPLDNLDANIRCRDALITGPGGVAWEAGMTPERTPWPDADVIIGNPPFLGSRYFAKEHGYDYVRAVHAVYPEIPKMADYCVYWFRRAHDHLRPATPEDPFRGRAGLVGTQNIRNNQSRVGGLDHVVASGTIVEAVENQPWSGEANVHVSIANWVKHEPPKKAGGPMPIDLEAALRLPPKRRLWAKVEPDLPLHEPDAGNPGVVTTGKRGKPLRHKSYELEARHCSFINSTLSDAVDVAAALPLKVNTDPQRAFQGQNPANDKFMLSPSEAKRLLAKNKRLREVIFPYMIGRDLVTDGAASRYIIDFARRDMLEAAAYPEAFAHVRSLVMPDVLARARREAEATGKTGTRWGRMADRWWQFRDHQPGMMAAISAPPRYIVCSRTTKRPIFAFVCRNVHPDTKLMVFAFADDYSFGVLQSAVHWQWFVTKSSKLTERFNYTPSSVWNTFPWPQSATRGQVSAVSQAAIEVRRVRDAILPTIKGGLRALYRLLDARGRNKLRDAHDELDRAVLRSYGFSPRKDLLRQLLDLNLEIAAAYARGSRVVAPGVPPGFKNPGTLISSDCITAAPVPRERASGKRSSP